MNKKGLIVLIVIISMFMLVGCGKKEEQKKSTDKVILIGSTIGDIKFTYPKSRSFSVKNELNKAEDNTVTQVDYIYSNDLAIKMNVTAGEMGLKQWNSQIKFLKDKKMYSEYKLKDHEAYIMDSTDKTMDVRVLIDSNKKFDEANVLALSVSYINPLQVKKPNIEKVFNDQIMKDFLNTMELIKE